MKISLKRRNQMLNNDLKLANAALLQKSKEIEELQAKLKEARRRTLICDSDGKSRIDFLPIAVLSYEMRNEPFEMQSWNGRLHHFAGCSHCELRVLASVEPGDAPSVTFERSRK